MTDSNEKPSDYMTEEQFIERCHALGFDFIRSPVMVNQIGRMLLEYIEEQERK